MLKLIQSSKLAILSTNIVRNPLLRASFGSFPHHHHHSTNSTPEGNNVDMPFASYESKIIQELPVEDDRTDPKESHEHTNINVDAHDHDDHHHKDDHGKSRTDDLKGYMAEKAKKGTKGAVETAFNAGEKVAEGMENTWGGVKETTKKIKEIVLGHDDDHGHDNDVGGRDGGDKYVDDLRDKADGYDKPLSSSSMFYKNNAK